MSDDHGDAVWEAFVLAMLVAARSRNGDPAIGDKSALFSASREIAHLEAPSVIDVRITRAGWSQVKDRRGERLDVLEDPISRTSSGVRPSHASPARAHSVSDCVKYAFSLLCLIVN
jgi:hypothetical protein